MAKELEEMTKMFSSLGQNCINRDIIAQSYLRDALKLEEEI